MTDYTYTDSFSPDSTLVRRAFYHRGERNLFVQFTGETFYGYANVPSFKYDEFAKSASAGNFYNTHIKGKFDAIKDVGNVEYIGQHIDEAIVADTHKFVIVGYSPVEYTLDAKSIDEAKADFARLFPNGTLKEVRVHFG